MGKKKLRAKYTSKGERHAIDPNIARLIRAGRTDTDRLMLQLKAWKKGKKITKPLPGFEFMLDSYQGRGFKMPNQNAEADV